MPLVRTALVLFGTLLVAGCLWGGERLIAAGDATRRRAAAVLLGAGLMAMGFVATAVAPTARGPLGLLLVGMLIETGFAALDSASRRGRQP